VPNNPPKQPNTPQDVLKEILIKHITKLDGLLTILYSGEARDKIEPDDISTFESDLRVIIADLRSRRNANGILSFVDSVDEIVDKVSDIVDNLTLAKDTFKLKNGGLSQRLPYFKKCRELLEDALSKFKLEQILPDEGENTGENACTA
jgi:hypothetical protein